MTELPNLPVQWQAIKTDVPPMRGVNWSDNIADGDLADSINLSTRRFPYLSQRRGRAQHGTNADVTAIYRYKDSLLTVEGAVLKRDGVQIGVCADGAKQWATVNTKVVMYPDAIMIDMETNEITQMGAAVHCLEDSNTTLTETYLQADEFPTVYEELQSAYSHREGEQTHKVTMCGSNLHDLQSAFDSDTGQWSISGIAAETKVDEIIKGDILMLQNSLVPANQNDTYNTSGYYGVVYKTLHSQYRGGDGIVRYNDTLLYNVYKVGSNNEMFVRKFEVGDVVEITGTPAGAGDSYNAKITAIDADLNKITFENGATFPTCYADMTAALAIGDNVYLKLWYASGENQFLYRRMVVGKNVSAGAVLVAYGVTGTSSAVEIFERTESGLVRVGKTGSEYEEQESPLVFNLFAPGHDITVTRKIPTLDYICAHDNRLFGVSNEDGKIWASALGLPTRFFDNEMVSTDSWSVAVAGNGAFTACCEYGDSVLFWKEERLYKLLGNTPDSYQLNDYVVPGVQAGAHGTQCIVDDVLIFKGVRGVYGYGGNVPTLLSEKFGEKRYTAATAGTDGERYYISLNDGSAWQFMVYDVRRGMWLREDDTEAVAWSMLPDGLAFVADDGKIYKADTGADDNTITWAAQFTPFFETIDGRKGFAKLLIRLEPNAGATVTVKVRTDGGAWQRVERIVGRKSDVVPVLIPINRCDKYEVRLDGTGVCAVLAMQKQFFVGSDA